VTDNLNPLTTAELKRLAEREKDTQDKRAQRAPASSIPPRFSRRPGTTWCPWPAQSAKLGISSASARTGSFSLPWCAATGPKCSGSQSLGVSPAVAGQYGPIDSRYVDETRRPEVRLL
jgi:hypothetical protein